MARETAAAAARRQDCWVAGPPSQELDGGRSAFRPELSNMPAHRKKRGRLPGPAFALPRSRLLQKTNLADTCRVRGLLENAAIGTPKMELVGSRKR